MEKIHFLLGMLAMSAGMFTSCDDDIENDGASDNQSENVNKKQKHLVARFNIDHNGNNYASYIYNADGKMADKSDQESYVENTFAQEREYFPTEGNIFNYSVIGKASLFTFSTNFNSDGTIVKEEQKLYLKDTLNSGATFVYNYDVDNHLVSSFKFDYLTGVKNEDYMCEWTWINGDVATFNKRDKDSISYSYKDSVLISNVTWSYKYTNDEYPTPINNETDISFFCHNDKMIGYCNRYGAVSKHLPVFIINEDTNYGERISWTFDNDGYPIKAELYWADAIGNYLNDKPFETINFVWE